MRWAIAVDVTLSLDGGDEIKRSLTRLRPASIGHRNEARFKWSQLLQRGGQLGGLVGGLRGKNSKDCVDPAASNS
jgi:hypothetical protein